MSCSNQGVLDETDDLAIRYASASEGLSGYDSWKCNQPPDDDQVYLGTWNEAEKRAMEMKRNALEMIEKEEAFLKTNSAATTKLLSTTRRKKWKT